MLTMIELHVSLLLKYLKGRLMRKIEIRVHVLFILAAVLIFLLFGKTIDMMAGWPSAIKSRSWIAVKLHFIFGADVNAVKPGFKTPLEESLSLQPSSAIITEILDHKPDRAKLVDKDKSLLIKAMSSLDFAKLPSDQTIEILKRLIELGEDVNFIEGASTPLFMAVYLNRPDLVKFMLESGAKPSIVISNPGNNLVHTIFDALRNCKNKEIIEILLKNGADLNLETLMQTVVEAKNMEAIKMLAKNGVSLNVMNPKQYTVLLMTAVASFDDSKVKEFVELGADINITDSFGRNVLATCVQKDRFKLAKYFIEKGTNVNYVDKFGQSLLSYFIDKQQTVKDLSDLKERMEFLAFLKDSGLNINFQNPTNGQTAVMRAICMENSDVWISLLVAMKDIDNNLQDNNGKTALMYAVEKKKAELVQILLLSKADTSIKDSKGQTALDYATEMDSSKVYDLLKNGVTDSE
ncbi:MAG: ankyrin repeat domain-containing protein [Candidatus Riflebacteria bacterium]|nr:ankyrin repeat domain-containing protein [Candidatus Riflebacteria bacterium]